jgi:flagellin-like protein
MRGRKAVSPVISTVLLIMIVIIIAIIILLWSRGFVQEAIEKDIAGSTKRINEFCPDVKLKSIVNSDGSFGFENIGNVPVFGFNLKISGDGDSEIINYDNEGGGTVNPGFSVLIEDRGSYDELGEVKVIPIILGESEGGQSEFECPEKNGFVI